MIDRCTNERNASFKHYGARGVTVCTRWLESIENFVADMGLRPEGKTLDRIDNSLGYGPDNCRWATELDQQRNRRNVKCSAQIAEAVRAAHSAGETQASIASRVGINQSVVSRITRREIWK